MIIVLNELDTSMFAPQQQQAMTLARNGCHLSFFPQENKEVTLSIDAPIDYPSGRIQLCL